MLNSFRIAYNYTQLSTQDEDVKQKDQRSNSSPAIFEFFNEIGIISQLSSTLFEKNLPEGLTNSQFSVLNWFTRVDEQATPGRLATAFQVTPGAMTNTLKKLEGKKLIKVEPDATSGRRKIVSITARGLKVRNKAIAAAAPLFKEFSEFLPAVKIEKQLNQLRKIRQYLDERRFKQQ